MQDPAPFAGLPARSTLAPHAEASVFWRLRRAVAVNLIRQSLSQSRLRLSLVALLTGILWVGLFALFAEGFEFLRMAIAHDVTHDETARAIFNIFFAALTMMLIVSTAIILYGGLYRSAEVRFLLTLPARDERVFLHKFQEAMLLASWGFLLLGSPMLVANGVVEDAGWHYYVLLPMYMLSFVYIPGSLGALVTLALVRWLPRAGTRLLWLAGGLAAALLAALGWSMLRGLEGNLLTPEWFQDMLGRLRFSENRLLPSWWLSSGLLEATRSGWQSAPGRLALAESVMFLAVTLSNALILHQAALWAAGRIYRAGYSAREGRHQSRKRIKPAWIDRAATRATVGLAPSMRLLLVKDLRLFRRDPVQWLQFLIFFGLLGLYFLNIRRLSYDVNYVNWVNMISFLNLAVVGLILSTFTTRFIFPMISIEGRRFWILGLLPVRRETILWGKFLFAALGSLVPCTSLILLSDVMLRVSTLVICVHMLVCVLLCTGLSGIAVGLGAKMPNLREDSPSRIAAGFGGTVNLMVGTAYIVSLVLFTAVPSHFFLAARQGMGVGGSMDVGRWLLWLTAGVLASALLGAAATLLPMWIGIRAFRRMEF